MKQREKLLNNSSRAWIYNKIQGYYRRELHFQGLDIPFYLSTFKFCLSESDNFQDLESYLKKYSADNCLNFVRKETKDNKKLYFSYPNLSFQSESLFFCWDEILKIQEQSEEDISRAINYQRDLKFMEDEDNDEIEDSLLDKDRFCYGNKPNPSVRLEPDFSKTIQEEEERKVFPISVDFKYEYNSFRKSVISRCESIIEKEKKSVIFIQTDIKTFFHKLQIESLAQFIKNKFPDAKNLYKYLKKLKDNKYNTLPIGWILSRFVANIIIQEFHILFRNHLSKKFQDSLEKEQRSTPENERTGFKAPVKLKYQISYVDDFIFLITIPADIKSMPDEKAITDILLKEANNLLKLNNFDVEFHEADSDKTKCHRLNKSNISTLKTNFAFFNTADDYLIGDSEIIARVDEIFLPVDNDITLNENQQFHRNLRGLQKIAIGNRHFKEKEVNDLLAQIKIKIEKTGSKYIRSVFRLFNLLELNEGLSIEIKQKIQTNEIKDIFQKFKKNHNYSSDWVKFFNGYFHFLSSIEYRHTDQFFTFLDQVSQIMETEDDKKLFLLLRNEYIFKIIINTPDQQKLKDTYIDESKKSKNDNILLNMSDQRNRSIKFLCKIISRTKSKVSYKLKPVDLTWMDIVLCQILLRRYNITATQIFLMTEKFKNETRIFNFSLPRIATVYLPFCTEDDQSEFIKNIKNYDFNQKVFWRTAIELTNSQKKIKNYYKFNEKERLKQIDNFLNENTNTIEEAHSLIWNFIKKSFSTDQDCICAYMIANRLNNDSEFIKYILTSFLEIESSKLTPWSVLPLTIQKTGIHTNLIIKEIFKIKYNETESISKIIKQNNIKCLLQTALDKIKIPKLEKFIESKYFGVNIIDLDLFKQKWTEKFGDKPFKVTVAPLYLDLKEDFDFNRGFKFKNQSEKRIDLNIRGAIDEAVRQESSILVFPEISLPRKYLSSYLKLASEHRIVLVGGLEYFSDIKKEAYNSTIVSIPVQRHLNPGGRKYFAFEQIKNFPSSEENYWLSKNNFKYQKGSGIFIFKSNFWGDFAVLTCSDFLSLGLRWILQGEVQTIFVPAQNKDSMTYNHISETSVRDLHCVTIVCNNPERGSSHCYAPYYDRSKRIIFKKIGVSKPEYHTFTVDYLKEFKKTQKEANPIQPFRNPDPENDGEYPYSKYKQLPPDWRFWNTEGD